MDTSTGGLLLDAVYGRVLAGEQCSTSHSPTYEIQDQAEKACQIVVENSALHPEGELGGKSGILLFSSGVHGEYKGGATGRFPYLKSSVGGARSTGKHSSQGNWEFLPQRAEDGEPCVVKHCKIFNFNVSGTMHQFLVVRARAIERVANPVKIGVVKVTHSNGKVVVAVDGQPPENPLSFLVVIRNVNPVVDGVHPLETLTGSSNQYSSFVIRIPARSCPNGFLYDCRGENSSKEPPSISFMYKHCPPRALYHVLPGDKTRLMEPRRSIGVDSCEKNSGLSVQPGNHESDIARGSGPSRPPSQTPHNEMKQLPPSTSTPTPNSALGQAPSHQPVNPQPPFMHMGGSTGSSLRESSQPDPQVALRPGHIGPAMVQRQLDHGQRHTSQGAAQRDESGGQTRSKSANTALSHHQSYPVPDGCHQKPFSGNQKTVQGNSIDVAQGESSATRTGSTASAPVHQSAATGVSGGHPPQQQANMMQDPRSGAQLQPNIMSEQIMRPPASTMAYSYTRPELYWSQQGYYSGQEHHAQGRPNASHVQHPVVPVQPVSSQGQESKSRSGETSTSMQHRSQQEMQNSMASASSVESGTRPTHSGGSSGNGYQASTASAPHRHPPVRNAASLNHPGIVEDQQVLSASEQPTGSTPHVPESILHQLKANGTDISSLIKVLNHALKSLKLGDSNDAPTATNDSVPQRVPEPPVQVASQPGDLQTRLIAPKEPTPPYPMQVGVPPKPYTFQDLELHAASSKSTKKERAAPQQYPPTVPHGMEKVAQQQLYQSSVNHANLASKQGFNGGLFMPSGPHQPGSQANTGYQVAGTPASQPQQHSTSHVQYGVQNTVVQTRPSPTNQQADSPENQPDSFRQKVPLVPKRVIPDQTLREYQKNAADLISVTSGNFLVRAPTGSGKTRIFIECARRLLMVNKHGRIIVLVPTQPLAEQQKEQFDAAGFCSNGYGTETFIGNKAKSRERLLFYSVLVMTVQVLYNLLRARDLTFQDFQMLVLDEVHHTRGSSPYAEVLKLYCHQPESIRVNVQVLGFTASPTHGTGMSEATKNLHKLLEDMAVKKSNVINIDEENEEVSREVPKATEEVVTFSRRDEDQKFITGMTKFLKETLRIYNDFLKKHVPGTALSVALPKKLQAVTTAECMDDWTRRAAHAVDMYEEKEGKPLPEAVKTDLKTSLDFISYANQEIKEVVELGFESTLRSVNGYLEDVFDHEGVCGTPQNDQRLLNELKLSFQESSNVRMVDGAPQVAGAGPTPYECGSLSKFAELEAVLDMERFRGPNFHAIIFVRTISSVNEICRMLQKSAVVGRSMEFTPLVGHGDNKKKARKGMRDAGVQGMKGTMQREALNRFRMPGRRGLVATRAAEEGLDVPSCELVVRYSVTITGVERVQSRGRARKIDGLYVNLIEKGSREETIYQRSKAQEEAGDAVVSLLCEKSPHL